jgi:N utilization substance protein B
MQALYASSRDPKMTDAQVLGLYERAIRRSYETYLFSLALLRQIIQFAVKDEARKKSKLRPSKEDLAFTAVLANNPLSQSLLKSEEMDRLLKEHKVNPQVDKDAIRRFYTDFAQNEEYKAYVLSKEHTEDDHQKMLLGLYKHCISDETFEEIIDDHYPSWADDKSLIIGAVKKTIKALPAAENAFSQFFPTEETVRDFGESLLRQTLEQNHLLLETIEPTLQNWDPERVAILDMILLKMALCELIHFPSIPSKVTLNEFVEISKLYSTDKSKDFINGILDRLMKQLKKEGRIKKEGRGLID